MKSVEKVAVALRECERCGNLVVVRYGVPEEHSSKGEPCKTGGPSGKPAQPKSDDL